jgi:uncharacterized protein involved in tolerance to divalent cations
VAVPSTPADAKGLLKAAIRDDNPVVFIEHETLYGQRGEVPENGGPMRFGEAAVRREGGDVTIIGVSRMAITAQKAADQLASEHEIEAEVIDPRTLRPLDLDTILESVKKTNRAVIVEERLAACAQSEGPISSTYWWEGKVETDPEWRVDFKTTMALLDTLTARVVELHSYDVPQVIASPLVGGLDAYLQWIKDETNGDAGS